MHDENIEKIKTLLKNNKEGLTLSEIAEKINVHRNSVSKYLDVMLTGGMVALRNIGRAKLYSISKSAPLSEILNISNNYNIIIDNNNTILQYSTNTEKLAKEKIKGKKLSETKILNKIISEVKKDITFNNRHYKTRIIPIVLENGEPGKIIIIEDITSEVRNKQDLKLFQKAVNSSASGITIADMKKKDQPLIFVNSAFEKITGYKSKEVIGKNCRFLQGKKTIEKSKQAIRDCIKDGKEGRFEILNYKKDGKTFWNELFLSPIKNRNGEITHYVGVQSDVSHRH